MNAAVLQRTPGLAFRPRRTAEMFYDGPNDVMLADLKKLVIWVHSHANICPHLPNLKSVSEREVDRNRTVCWQCKNGHAYKWLFHHFPKSHNMKNRGKRKRPHMELKGEDLGLGPVHFQQKKRNKLFDSLGSPISHVSGKQGLASQSRINRFVPKLAILTSSPDPIVTADKTGVPEGPSDHSLEPVRAGTSVDHHDEHSQRKDHKCSEVERPGLEGSTATSIRVDPSLSGYAEGMKSDTDSVLDVDKMWSSPKSGAQSFHHRLLGSSPEPASNENTLDSCALLPSPAEGQALQKIFKTQAKAETKELNKTSRSGITDFKNWLLRHRPEVTRSLSDLSAKELNDLVVSYFHQLKSRELSSSSLSALGRGIDRYLREHGCAFSLYKSKEMISAYTALQTRMRELQWQELESHLDIRNDEEKELRERGVLSRQSPQGLLNLVLLNNLRAFGKGHLRRDRVLFFGEFCLGHEPQPALGNRVRLEYLEWKNSSSSFSEPCAVRMYALIDNPACCPLQDFNLYAAKHIGGFPSYFEAFYLTPNACLKPVVWYSREPLCRRRLEKMIKALSQYIQIIRAQRQAE
ncbi:hypothetical protein AOLI_G00150890 [Acnodon oligacanthus]